MGKAVKEQLEGTVAKGANGTKKEDCTNVHSESYIQEQGRERVEGGGNKVKTVFDCSLGFYECERMNFGLTNVRTTFKRLMERCMCEPHLKECFISKSFFRDLKLFSKSLMNLS